MRDGEVLVWFLAAILALAIYFIPTIIAFYRGHGYRWVIFALNLVGGFILRGHQSSGTINSLSPGEEIDITSKRIFGIGRTDVILTIEMPDGTIYKSTENGIIFLILIMV